MLRGAAELVNEDGRTSLGAGERAFARGGRGAVSAVRLQLGVVGRLRSLVGSPPRCAAGRVGGVPARDRAVLRVDLQSSTATGRTSRPTATSGIRACAPGWRPYYYGRWTTLRPWGWTWIGSDPWAWPTHHYGRWGFSAGVVVLDSRPHVGSGVGLLGLRARLRQLVPARLEQPRGLRFLDVDMYGGHRLQPVERVDGRAASRLRPRLRQRQRRQLDAHRRAHAQRVRDSATPRRTCGATPSRARRAPIRSVGGRARTVERGQRRTPRIAQRAGRRRRRPLHAGDAGAAVPQPASSSAPLSGSGYPAPAREPRADVVAASADAPGSARPGRETPAAPAASGRTRRRTPRADARRRASRGPSAPTLAPSAHAATPIAVATTRPSTARHARTPTAPGTRNRPDVVPSRFRAATAGQATDVYRAPPAPLRRGARRAPIAAGAGCAPTARYRARGKAAPGTRRTARRRATRPDRSAPSLRPAPERSAPAAVGPATAIRGRRAAIGRAVASSGAVAAPSGGGESRSRRRRRRVSRAARADADERQDAGHDSSSRPTLAVEQIGSSSSSCAIVGFARRAGIVALFVLAAGARDRDRRHLRLRRRPARGSPRSTTTRRARSRASTARAARSSASSRSSAARSFPTSDLALPRAGHPRRRRRRLLSARRPQHPAHHRHARSRTSSSAACTAPAR